MSRNFSSPLVKISVPFHHGKSAFLGHTVGDRYQTSDNCTNESRDEHLLLLSTILSSYMFHNNYVL